MAFFLKNPIFFAYLCGFCLVVLTKLNKIKILLKSDEQRNDNEKRMVKKGLKIDLLMALIVHTPLSITLFWFAIFPLIKSSLLEIQNNILFWSGMVGIVGYGFPFSLVKRFATKVTYNTLDSLTKSQKKS
ncbi:MAG: hypothetical protein GY874_19765 [Desulfobacteraceae bacterium]|nr:hypothetical protein [Desulfobacteraceae bacterium]